MNDHIPIIDDFVEKHGVLLIILLITGGVLMYVSVFLIDYHKYGWGYNEQRTIDYYNQDGVSLLDSTQYLNYKTGDDSLVMTYFEEKTYLLDKKFMLGDPFYNTHITYDNINTSKQFCELWHNLNITHLLIGKGWERWETNSYQQNYDSKRLLPLLANATIQHALLVFEKSDHAVWKLDKDCKQQNI